MRERTRLDVAIQGYRELERRLREAVELIELGEAESEDEVVAEAEAQLEALKREADKRQIETLLSGEADANSCYLEVHAGAGGTESQDWAEMLLRMYSRWADGHDYETTLIEESPGEEAGLKSATWKIGASSSLLMATMTLESFMPARCWMAPEMPTAM